MYEFETTLAIAGQDLPALVKYERELDDGWPLINAVEVGRMERTHYDHQGRWLEVPQIKWVAVDITRILDGEAMRNLEEEIIESDEQQRNEAQIETATEEFR